MSKGKQGDAVSFAREDPHTPATLEFWASRVAAEGREREAQEARDLANAIRLEQREAAAAPPAKPQRPEREGAGNQD